MKVDIIVAPRRFREGLLARDSTKTGEFGLLAPPENPGFKCWVKYRPGIWEHGKDKLEAIEMMTKRLPCHQMTLGNVIHQEECTD